MYLEVRFPTSDSSLEYRRYPINGPGDTIVISVPNVADAESLFAFEYRVVSEDFWGFVLARSRVYGSDTGSGATPIYAVIDRVPISDGLGGFERGGIDPERYEQWQRRQQRAEQIEAQGGLCFAAGTPVRMADGTEKPIERVDVGEWVMAFDSEADHGRGALVPSQVTRTMVSHGQLLLDFHGTKVTPGHVFLTGDDRPDGKGVFKRLIDILVEDGTVVNAEGTVLRAATNSPVGSPEDRFVEVAEIWPEKGSIGSRPARLRAGTWLIRDDGTATTLLDCMTREGFALLPDGRVSHRGGPSQPMLMQAPVPRPETYVLKRSGPTLEQIYAHASLRDVAPAALAARGLRQSGAEVSAPAGMQMSPADAGDAWPQGWTPSGCDADTLIEQPTMRSGNRAARCKAGAIARNQGRHKSH